MERYLDTPVYVKALLHWSGSHRIISPAGFEGFFRELSDMTAVRAPDPAAIAALGERYHLPFGQPDWLPDVIARYGLIPPRH